MADQSILRDYVFAACLESPTQGALRGATAMCTVLDETFDDVFDAYSLCVDVGAAVQLRRGNSWVTGTVKYSNLVTVSVDIGSTEVEANVVDAIVQGWLRPCKPSQVLYDLTKSAEDTNDAMPLRS